MDQQVRRRGRRRIPPPAARGVRVLIRPLHGVAALLALGLAGCGGPEGSVRIPGRPGGLAAFRLDRREVTTAEFRSFAGRAGYRTDAEAIGWSLVFHPPGTEPAGAPVIPSAPWWVRVEGADWRRPRGPARPPAADDHPAVQVSWNDAAAFCREAGGRLPTGAEWEHAARGGRGDGPFPWGERSPFSGAPVANLWDGLFPAHPGPGDRFPGIAPVGRFPRNGFGLFDMAGNVWEWVDGGGPEDRRMRGGSFLCAENSCQGYRLSWENRAPADSAWDHTGFRCAF